MNVGDFVEYVHAGRKATGTIVEMFESNGNMLARVQLATSLFGYTPPELVVANTKALRVLGRSAGAQA